MLRDSAGQVLQRDDVMAHQHGAQRVAVGDDQSCRGEDGEKDRLCGILSVTEARGARYDVQ